MSVENREAMLARARRNRRMACMAMLVASVLGMVGLGTLAARPTTAAAATAMTYASGDTVTPVVAYDFDSDSGLTVKDGTGIGGDGAWSGSPAYVAGVSGRAAHVSAGTNFITLPRNAKTEITTGSSSVEFWYRQNTATGDGPLFGNENWNSGSNPGFVLFTTNGTSDERLGVNIGDGSGSRVKAASLGSPLNSAWIYLTLVIDRSTNTMTTYENGVAVNASSIASITRSLDGGSNPFRIGQDGTGAYGQSVNGLVDDLNLYSAAITPEQIRADYAATRPDPTHASGDAVVPIASYTFDNDAASTVTDSSGSGTNARWSATPAYGPGIFGQAAHLNAGNANDHISLPLVTGKTDGSTSFAAEFWWKDVTETGDAPFFGNANFASCANAGLMFFHGSGSYDQQSCYSIGGSRTYTPRIATGHQNSWVYYALSYDAAAHTYTFYANGVQQSQTSTASGSTAANFVSGLPFTLGNDGTGTYGASSDAYVDDVNFYNSALSSAQITADYAATDPVLPPADTSKFAEGFLASDLTAATVRVGDAVTQHVAGLWVNGTPASFSKVGGDSWLQVDGSGVITGTAPSTAPQNPGLITVQGVDGPVTSRITISIPVIAATDAPQLWAASWNLWDAGARVNDSLGKDIQAIARNGLTLIGVQEDGGTMAKALATQLGWYSYEGAGGLGIVSAYPIASNGIVSASSSAPAAGVTITAAGKGIRVWDAALDENSAATRNSQAAAIVAKLTPELAGSSPVVLLGDLAASGAVAPFTSAGMKDAYAEANAGAPVDQGYTLLFASPRDRVDFVLSGGQQLALNGSSTVVTGYPSATQPADNSWTSDHAAVAAVFTLGAVMP